MYTKVEEGFWKDGKMIKLSFRARYLMLYLLTSPHRNILCYYFMPKPYACFDLGFSEEEFSESMQELVESERVYYDSESNVVFVKNYLKFNQLENKNQVKSAIGKISEIPDNSLIERFIEHLQKLNKDSYKPLIEVLCKRLGKGLDEPLPQPDNREQITDNSISSTTIMQETEEKANTEDNDLAEVYKIYENNIRPVTGSIEADKLNDMLQRFGKAWVIKAIERAVERNKRSPGYIEGILKNWQTNGFDDGDDQGGINSKRGRTYKGKTTDRTKTDWDNEPDGLPAL